MWPIWLKRLLNTPTALFSSRMVALKKLGFSPRLILDIGAYHGGWAKLAHQLFPQSKMFLIEANKNHQPALQKLDFIKGFDIALLGEKPKKSVNFYLPPPSRPSAGSSIYKEQTQAFNKCKVRKLPMNTLDSVVKKLQLKNIDFIKIDTQGSELNILKGGLKTVLKAEFILLETQILEYNLGAPYFKKVLDYMEKINFKLFDITEIHHLPSGEMSQLDLLFVKSSSKFIKTDLLY